MKRLLYLLTAIVLTLSLVVPLAACQTDLMTDGGDTRTLVGTVSICDNVSENILWVCYDLSDSWSAGDNWTLEEAHLHVAADPEDVPQKNGNPRPGKFENKKYYDPVDENITDCFTVPLPAGVLAGDNVSIALHLGITRNIGTQAEPVWEDETAWIVGDNFTGKNWAMYYVYEVGSLDCYDVFLAAP